MQNNARTHTHCTSIYFGQDLYIFTWQRRMVGWGEFQHQENGTSRYRNAQVNSHNAPFPVLTIRSAASLRFKEKQIMKREHYFVMLFQGKHIWLRNLQPRHQEFMKNLHFHLVATTEISPYQSRGGHRFLKPYRCSVVIVGRPRAAPAAQKSWNLH